jgi:uncharacterized protein YbjQ (UPF0145 family)
VSDVTEPRGPDGEPAFGGPAGSIPAMPRIRPRETGSDYPYPVLDGLPRTIGWQWLSAAKGGPVFVVIARGGLGGLKVLQRFPLTEDGWGRAWQWLAAADPDGARKIEARLLARQAEDARAGMQVLVDSQPVLIVTTDEIPGYRITQVHGDVFGLTVRARDYFSNMGASFRTLVGGEVGEYTKMLTESRNQARERMWREARARGANAIVGMRFDCNEIGNIMSEVAAYGTAVSVESLDARATTSP